MYVANVVTKEWKVLPCRPCMNRPDIVQLVAVETNAYKMILVTLEPRWSPAGPFLIQIYDSRTDSWALRTTTTEICTFEINCIETFVYLGSASGLFIIVQSADADGILYEILGYNVEDNSWTRIPHPEVLHDWKFFICALVACGSEVMLVTGTAKKDPGLRALGFTGSIRLSIYRLDIASMNFEFFSGGPSPGDVKDVYNVDHAVGGGEYLYLGLRSAPTKPCLMFNIREKVWSTLAPVNKSWLPKWAMTTKFPFQPGLNPFLILRTEVVTSAPDTGGLGESKTRDAGQPSGSGKQRPYTDMEDVD